MRDAVARRKTREHAPAFSFDRESDDVRCAAAGNWIRGRRTSIWGYRADAGNGTGLRTRLRGPDGSRTKSAPRISWFILLDRRVRHDILRRSEAGTGDHHDDSGSPSLYRR